MSHEHEHDTLCPSTAKIALPAAYCTFCTLIRKVEERARHEQENYRP